MKKVTILFVLMDNLSKESILKQATVASLYKRYGAQVTNKTSTPITGEILVIAGNQVFQENFAKQYGPNATVLSMADVVETNFKAQTTVLSLAQYIVGVLENSTTSTAVRKAFEKVIALKPTFLKKSWTVEQLLINLLTTENSFFFCDADQYSIAEKITLDILNGITVTEENGFRAVTTNQVLPSKTTVTAWVAKNTIAVLSRTTPSIWKVEQNAVFLPTNQTIVAKNIVTVDSTGYGVTDIYKSELLSRMCVAFRNATITGEITLTPVEEMETA